jgi:hypothetical protein
MERRVYNWNYEGYFCISVEKLKHLKGSLAEVYYGMSFNNLPCCEIKMMGINGVLETLV